MVFTSLLLLEICFKSNHTCTNYSNIIKPLADPLELNQQLEGALATSLMTRTQDPDLDTI